MIELAALVPALPLPLAQLLRRALNSHSPLELHHNAHYLAEAALKLAASARIGLWLDRALEPGHPVAIRLEALTYPSLGQWRDFLRDIDRVLAQHPERASLPLGACLGKLAQAREWKGVASFASAAIEAGAVSEEVGRTALDLGLLGFFDIVVSYRNRVIAHGGQRLSSYYERMGELLLQALRDVLPSEEMLGSLRLVYARLRLPQADEDPSLYWQDLRGVASLPLDPEQAGMPSLTPPDRSLAGRVCLVEGAGVIPLHPLVVYRIDEAGRESFGFLNRTIRRPVKTEAHPEEFRRADYLDYATGETLSGVDMRAALTALISRLRGCSATAEDVRAAQDASLAEAEPDPEPYAVPKGVTIGDFEILQELGRGGMGVVYQALQSTLNRQVALKVLPPSLAGDSNVLRRFRREMSALGRCDHPNVVKILTSGIDADRYFYAMELIQGADLGRASRVLRRWREQGIVLQEGHLAAALHGLATQEPGEERCGEVPPDSTGRSLFVCIAELFAEAAAGLEHLHSRGILHRDIKPSNLLLTSDARRIVVMDLGLARLPEVSQTSSRSAVRILGTLRYAAPEQLVRRLAEVDYRADLYALGASLYELATGRALFDGDTESRLVRQILYEEPTPARVLEPRLPAALAAILSVATAKDPSARYPSAAAFAADLRAFAQGQPTQGVSALRLLPGWQLVRKRPVAVVGAGIAAAALLAATLLGWNWNRTRTRLCAGQVRRWEVMNCVNPLQPSQAAPRSVSYRFQERRGTVFRVDRVNGLGQPVADEEGEASWELTYAESGRLASVAARDSLGNLQLRWVYSADLTRAERKDANNNPKPQEGTEISVYRLDFDARGYRRSVLFNNIYGYPIPDQDKCYGHGYEVDDRGNVVGIDHLGEDGRVAPTRGGIAREVAQYVGVLEVEHRFFDGRGGSALNREGVAGYRWRYDPFGNRIEQLSLGEDNKPSVNEAGIAGWRAVYDERGNRVSETYLGPEAQPRESSEGYAGWRAAYNDRGQVVERSYLDPQGSPQMIRAGYALWRGTYDGSSRLVDESYFDEQGKATLSAAGYARRTFAYDSRGRVVREAWLDTQGRPALTRLGYAGWRAEHDARGNEVLRLFLGADGEPVTSSHGYAGWRVEHDERGTQVQITYLGPDLKTTRCANGYAIVRTLYNSRGDIVESAFFDEQDRPVLTSDGYAIVRRQYDRRGNQVEESYWGTEGKPTVNRRGYFLARQRFDDKGNKIEEAWVGVDGAPSVLPEGYALWRASYDARGRETEVSYYDALGRPTLNREGYARRRISRDDRGRVSGEAYFGVEGNPVETSEGFTRWVALYDASGRILEQEFFGLEGKAVQHKRGYAVRRFRYDARGRGIEIAWLDAGRRPVTTPWGASLKREYDEAGNVVRESFFDAEARPAMIAGGYAGRRLRVDERGRVVEVTFLDAQGDIRSADRGPAIERRQYDRAGRLLEVSYFSREGAPQSDRNGVSSIRFSLDAVGRRVSVECTSAEAKATVKPALCSVSASAVRDNPIEDP